VVQTGLPKPFLFFFSDRPTFNKSDSELIPEARALLDATGLIRRSLPNEHNQVILLGSRHYNFADATLLTEIHFGRLVGMVGPIDQRRALAVTRRYVRAFFDRYLKAMPDNLLDGPNAAFPEVRFE
jgi:hypothetical protein